MIKSNNLKKILIEWGKLKRSLPLEKLIFKKASKILSFNPTATNLIIGLNIINSRQSSGLLSHEVSMELRIPNKQDIIAKKSGRDLYTLIKKVENIILIQTQN